MIKKLLKIPALIISYGRPRTYSNMPIQYYFKPLIERNEYEGMPSTDLRYSPIRRWLQFFQALAIILLSGFFLVNGTLLVLQTKAASIVAGVVQLIIGVLLIFVPTIAVIAMKRTRIPKLLVRFTNSLIERAGNSKRSTRFPIFLVRFTNRLIKHSDNSKPLMNKKKHQQMPVLPKFKNDGMI